MNVIAMPTNELPNAYKYEFTLWYYDKSLTVLFTWKTKLYLFLFRGIQAEQSASPHNHNALPNLC